MYICASLFRLIHAGLQFMMLLVQSSPLQPTPAHSSTVQSSPVVGFTFGKSFGKSFGKYANYRPLFFENWLQIIYHNLIEVKYLKYYNATTIGRIGRR